MDINYILSLVDHTLLSTTATLEEIKQLIDEGIYYKTASVCLPPSYVKDAVLYSEGRVPICTVIGFPNGYNSRAVKEYETADALSCGADEIDMVINICNLKSGNVLAVSDEIKAIRKLTEGKILKVIIEACLLTQDEKIELCRIITEAGADYIKTSTGFSKGGATREDIELFKNHIGPNVKIKAAGGIKTFDDAIDFINLSCSRLGTSSIVRLCKGEAAITY